MTERKSSSRLLSVLVPRTANLVLGLHYISSRGIVWLSVLGYAVGVTALIVVSSVMNGFAEQVRKSVRGSLSDLTIKHQSRGLEEGSEAAVPDFERIRAVLATVEGVQVTAIARRITWFGVITQVHDGTRIATDSGGFDWSVDERGSINLLQGRGDVIPCELVGIDLEDDRLATNFHASIRDLDQRPTRHVPDIPVIDPDDPFNIANPPDEALLPASKIGTLGNRQSNYPLGIFGAYLPRDLRLERGDSVSVMVPPQDMDTSEGAMPLNTREIILAGTFRTGKREFDGNKIFLDREQLATQVLKVTDHPERFYTEVVVKAAVEEEQLGELQRRVAKALREDEVLGSSWRFDVQTWMQQRRTILQAIDYEKVVIVLLLGLIVVVAGINMFTTLWMMVTEKTKDVGILAALGTSRLGVLQLFITMGVFIAVIGGALGFLGGLAMVRHISAIEEFLYKTFDFKMFNPEIYMFDSLPAVLDLEGVYRILAWTLIGAIVFSVAPAIRAALKHPVQALRYE